MPGGFELNPNFGHEAGEFLQLGHFEEEEIVDMGRVGGEQHGSHIFKLVRATGHRVTKSRTLFLGAGKFRKRALETSIARNSIGNRFPVQKYIEAMVRKSIRVVLVAENDSIEVASDAGAD
jgi:hypothetical protein